MNLRNVQVGSVIRSACEAHAVRTILGWQALAFVLGAIIVLSGAAVGHYVWSDNGTLKAQLAAARAWPRRSRKRQQRAADGSGGSAGCSDANASDRIAGAVRVRARS